MNNYPKILAILFFVSITNISIAQNNSRIYFSAITSSINTSMDFTSWNSDDINNLVPNDWLPINMQYVDVKITLQTPGNITSLSLYDGEGIFDDNPATIYAINGTQKTLIGAFTGDLYNQWVTLNPAQTIYADAILVHKYGNNIPQKIFVYGSGSSQPVTISAPANIDTVATQPRLYFSAITPSINTGMDYSSWYNDNTTNLVPNDWMPINMQYVDVNLTLKTTGKITGLSLYDGEGIFDNYPVTLYAVNGTQKTLLGTFTGDLYNQWVPITLSQPVTANAIIVHKYGNDIPQKISVYGTPVNVSDSISIPPTAIDSAVSTAPIVITAPLVTDSSTVTVPIITDTIATVPPKLTDTITSSNPIPIPPITVSNLTSYGTSTLIGTNPAIPIIYDTTIIKIPIDGNRWYQLDNVSNGLQALFDGDTTTDVFTGWGKLLTNFDAYYPVADDEAMNIYKIKFFDGAGTLAQPMTLFAIDNLGIKTLIGTFGGLQYNQWVGPYPTNTSTDGTQFNLIAPVKNVRYLVINSSSQYPTEMQIFGTYKAGAAATEASPTPVKLSQMFGINAFEWNFLNVNSPTTINEAQMKAAKSFTQVRHYLDWEKLESTQGAYTFSPSHSGGWDFDVMYQRLKTEGIDVLADIKTCPQWMMNTYPSNLQNNENVPVIYGKDFTDPNSYLEQAKVAFQFAARYGSNKNIDVNLESVDPSQRWNGDGINIVKTGLGLIKYIECDNERDKWWKGRQAYQTAFEYAANLSAFYDGNKNTMGLGVGVKNADPTMQVVMCGTALATTDYVRGMVDWCKLHRGYKSDGTVNLCWDVINYHLYSNNTASSQGGNSTAGAAPEVSGADITAKSFINASHQYVQDMPVWITELGYDVNQGSPLKAIPIGDKSASVTQADWELRSSLLYARSGVQRVFFYEMYNDDSTSSTQFASSGLINSDNSRTPAADYMYQTNKLLGAYSYSSTINSSPFVDVYSLNGKNAYVLVMPTENGSTSNYTLDLNQADSAFVYSPAIGQDSMSVKKIKTNNGKIVLSVTETPQFVIPSGIFVANRPAILQASNGFNIYPNPIQNLTTITYTNNYIGNVVVTLYDISGRISSVYTVFKSSATLIDHHDFSSLKNGTYILQLKTDSSVETAEIIKVN